jgi:NADPH-dependent curcumin reductase CurA
LNRDEKENGKYIEVGIENAPPPFIAMLDDRNTGKQLVEVSSQPKETRRKKGE